MVMIGLFDLSKWEARRGWLQNLGFCSTSSTERSTVLLVSLVVDNFVEQSGLERSLLLLTLLPPT